MRRAISLARRGWGRTAPNPMVGAVVVQGGRIVGEGWHAQYGGPHAEVGALEGAGELAKGAEVFVSLEPCAHQGKTPPCADALIAAGVARVVIAARDPNPEARGGIEKLRAAGIDVAVGVEEGAARELNAPFFFAFSGAGRPFVTLKLALSVEGAIAPASRQRQWLTGEPAQRKVHRLRAGVDAIAVGIGTVIADDPQLTVRSGPRPRVAPVRVVFDQAARLPLDSRLVRTARKVPVRVLAERPDAARRAALEDAGVEVIQANGLAAQLAALQAAGIRHLMVEGGAGLASSLLRAGAVDRLIIFQSPARLGSGALPAFSAVPSPLEGQARWTPIERKTFGDDTMTVYMPPTR